jgi:hypothetical protein
MTIIQSHFNQRITVQQFGQVHLLLFVCLQNAVGISGHNNATFTRGVNNLSSSGHDRSHRASDEQDNVQRKSICTAGRNNLRVLKNPVLKFQYGR